MRKSFSLAFDEGQRVYLACEPAKKPGIVLGYLILQGATLYRIGWADDCSDHYAVELTTEYVNPDFITEDEND
jgi:hypothetical protein